MVSPFTENALYSMWQLIAYKYVCAASQLFFFQQLVSAVGFSVYSTVDRRTGKRIALIVSFAKMFNISKKTRQTDGHRMTAYTACIASRGKKSPLLRTPAFIFCLPWGRPCGNHAKRCMNEQTVQCLPNASQHVPIYLQQFQSCTMLKSKSMRKSKNRYFYHILVSPGDAPGAITLNVVWMEREFDAYKLSR